MPRRPRDEGFTVVEVMVAMTVFAIIAASVLSAVLTAQSIARSDRARVTAANLAARELEITRSQFESAVAGPRTVATGLVTNPNPLPGGTAGSALVVDGLSYTVKRTSAWQSQAAATGACDGGANGQLAYLRVSVTVSWPTMRGTAPVTSSTLLTPTVGTYASGTGHVKVQVADQLGVPLEDLTVTLTGTSGSVTQQTGSDGCAYFAFLTPGDYTAKLSTPGYVDNTWDPAPTQSLTVTANTVQSVTFAYARAATLSLDFATTAGFSAPTATPITVYNTGLASSTRTKVVTGTGIPRVFTLWPYPDGVVAWAGSCLDADPQSYLLGTRPNPVVTNPGATTTGSVKTGAATIKVTTLTGTPIVGATVVAVHAVDSACPGPVTDPVDGGTRGSVLTVPTVTDATGTVRAALPFGTWTFKVIGKQPVLLWPSATLASTALTPASVAAVVK